MSRFVPRTDRHPSAMHLLASYLPYEISAGQDGGWSFWNRHQYRVGVNLSEGDDRWRKLWDSYPPWRVEPRGIGNAAIRALSSPEWLAADGNPVEAVSIRLYGTTSHPTASEDGMAAYLERLRILMEAGAMRTHFHMAWSSSAAATGCSSTATTSRWA